MRFGLIAFLVTVLSACASQPKIVLLGEIHDHELGHQARLAWLQQALDDGWRPALALEQFDIEHQALLTQAQAQCADDVDCIVQTAKGSAFWPWPYYYPVLQLAKQYQLPLIAANLSRTDASSLMRDANAIPAHMPWLADYLSTVDDAWSQAMAAEVRQAHCNKLPESIVPGMARAQLARDAAMAHVLKQHASRGVVLLAGNGHVRRDLGVPRWLERSYAIGFITVDQDAEPFDVVVRLPKHDQGDPCALL